MMTWLNVYFSVLFFFFPFFLFPSLRRRCAFIHPVAKSRLQNVTAASTRESSKQWWCRTNEIASSQQTYSQWHRKQHTTKIESEQRERTCRTRTSCSMAWTGAHIQIQYIGNSGITTNLWTEVSCVVVSSAASVQIDWPLTVFIISEH